jgi:hypothetical protein
MLNDSIDLLCRKVLMSAYLYYVCDTAVWSDAAYDQACEKIAGYWPFIPVEYKVLFDPEMTNDPATVRSTGMHFLVTERIMFAATSWFLNTMKQHLELEEHQLNCVNKISYAAHQRRVQLYGMLHG